MAAVLIVATDVDIRAALTAACRAYGIPVRSVTSIAEVERWPIRQTVVTDAAHLTPFWQEVGAARVIVVVDDPEEGAAALTKGATNWLGRQQLGGQDLIQVLSGRGPLRG